MQLIKCVCETCDGTGIEVTRYYEERLGIFCRECNGYGCYDLEISDDVCVASNEENNIIKIVYNEKIFTVRKFEKIKKIDNISYVTYPRNYFLKLKNPVLIEDLFLYDGVSEINVITYQEFINGITPLPFYKYNCPYQLKDNYFNSNMDFYCKEHSDNLNSGRILYIDEHCGYECAFYCFEEIYKHYDAYTMEQKQELMKKKVLSPVKIDYRKKFEND